MSHQECPDPVSGAVVRELTMGHGDDHQGPGDEAGKSSGSPHEEASEEALGQAPKGAVGFGAGPLGHARRHKPATCPNEVCVNHAYWYPGCTAPVWDENWEWVLGWYRCIRCDTIFEWHLKGWDDIYDKQERI